MSANFSPDMVGYSDIRPFRFWCQKVLPLVYDDSLSYYELLCKVTNYINHIIEDLSAAETNVDSLKTAYDELEQYVNDYFESLDIQQEIDNRLDEMVEDGTLSAMIAPLVPPIIVDWLEEHITPSDPPIDNSLSIEGAAADAAATGTAIWGGRARTLTPYPLAYYTPSAAFTLADMPMNSYTYCQFSYIEASYADWGDIGLSSSDYVRVCKYMSTKFASTTYVVDIECRSPRVEASIWVHTNGTPYIFVHADKSYVDQYIWQGRAKSNAPYPWVYYPNTSGVTFSVQDMPFNSWTYCLFSQIKGSFATWPVTLNDGEAVYVAKHRASAAANIYFLEFITSTPHKEHFYAWHFVNDTYAWYVDTFMEDIWAGRNAENTPYPLMYFPQENYVTFDVHDMPINSWTYCQFSKFKDSFSDWHGAGFVDANYVFVHKQAVTYLGNVFMAEFVAGSGGFAKCSVWVFANNNEQWFVDGVPIEKKLRLACLGDSITYGTVGIPDGPNGYTTKAYPYWLQQLNNDKIVVDNLGVGSSGWITTQYQQTPAYNYVKGITWTNYDAVTLCYGQNDWDNTLGTVDDTEPTTILGAAYSTIEWIAEHNPDIVITVIGTPWTKGSNGDFPDWATWADTMNAKLEELCDKYHVHFISMANWCNSWNIEDLIGDNVHPSLAGYEVMGRYISGQLKSVIG